MIERPLETPDIAIEVEDPKAMTVELPGLTIELGGEESPEDEFIEHNENLAEHIDPAELGSIGNELVQAYDADKQSRKDWEDTYIKGLELLGLKIEELRYRVQIKDGPELMNVELVFEGGITLRKGGCGGGKAQVTPW